MRADLQCILIRFSYFFIYILHVAQIGLIKKCVICFCTVHFVAGKYFDFEYTFRFLQDIETHGFITYGAYRYT